MPTKVRAVANAKMPLPEITKGMIVGFLIGLPIAGMVGGFVSWLATQRRAQELAGDYRLYQVVIVTRPIRAGEPLEASSLARRPVPAMVVSANTVSPDELPELLGREPLIGFEPGDLLLRTAFGLPPREHPPGAEQEPAEPSQ